ncbi:putative receptor-like protein kinase [Acorus gramineus]|uniref:Receptor-like protein kinase n=1 Tax=Acorus gramineus TaxID=55184 RepID=A0AAV9A416_ACOGR|nr:putative receptor-like protein kinase [Acorus gramineus]
MSRWRGSLIYYIFSKETSNDNVIVEKFMKDYHSMLPTKFSYLEVKRLTNGFRNKLGQGGYGSVYKGKLANGHPIAAKILEKSKDNGQDFINEVATIGRIHHFSIIRLLGFCCEGSRRALIYEYMPNGSLGDLIFDEEARRSLSREKLLEIAIGIAEGIQYMHSGCDTRILHLDIKPQNILLDHDYHPKISDFGLAKLYSRKNSVVSLTCARGTIGYIAPEVFMRSVGCVTHKSDVYSYGMLLLDMIVGRKNTKFVDERSSMSYFPDWIYTQLDQWNETMLVDEGLCIARKMVLVGLWCIQINPSNRPPINRVLEMLKGDHDGIENPPKPFFPSSTVEPFELQSFSVDTIKDTTSLTSKSM